MKKKRLLIPWSMASCMSRDVAEGKGNVAISVKDTNIEVAQQANNIFPVNFNLAHQNKDRPTKSYQPNSNVDAESIEAIGSKWVSLTTYYSYSRRPSS
jgi:hypothetical protein